MSSPRSRPLCSRSRPRAVRRRLAAARRTTIGPQTTIGPSRGYTCVDPRGDISLDTKAIGKLTQPAGIDILRASANVEGSTLVVHFLTAGPIAKVRQPLFDMEQGDISAAPEQSFELRAEPVGSQGPGGRMGPHVAHVQRG